jgi:hypothetical protein
MQPSVAHRCWRKYAIVAEPEYLTRHALLVRALSEHTEIAQPLVHARRVPAVSVATDQELEPVPAARIALHRRSELHRAFDHRLRVVLGLRRVSEGLLVEIAPVADQLPE